MPEPAGSLFSPKSQLWNFAAHKAALLLPREGSLSDGQLRAVGADTNTTTHTSGAQGAAPAHRQTDRHGAALLPCANLELHREQEDFQSVPWPARSLQVSELTQPWEAAN